MLPVIRIPTCPNKIANKLSMEEMDYVTEDIMPITPEGFRSEEEFEISECVLSRRQVFHIVWSSLCIIANIILMFMLRRKTRDSFCFTMLHWCLSNLIYMGIWFYFGVVPESCTSYDTEVTLHILGTIFIYLSEVHAVMLLSNNIMSSLKRCQYIVHIIWIIVFSFIAIFSRMHIFVDTDKYLKFTLTGAITIACLMVLSTKIFIKQTEPNNYLNMALASITVASSFFLWLSQIVFDYFNMSNIAILDTFIVILYGASIANLALFIYYDDDTKKYILHALDFKTHIQILLITQGPNENTVINTKEKKIFKLKLSVTYLILLYIFNNKVPQWI